MKIIRDYKNCPEVAKNGVVAIGNFDGVHKGHIAVIEKAREIAEKEGAKPSIFTFEPHPLKLLRPEMKPFRITSEEQKAALMKGAGIESLFVINFDKKFSQIKADEFIKEILVEELAVKHVITGADFVFGNSREGSPEMLTDAAEQYNFGYTKVAPIGDSSEIFSSSLVRKNIAGGRLDNVKSMLGRNLVICGVVIEGNKQGRIIGFPTINISLGDYIRPAFGVYAARIYIEGRKEVLCGAANIGIRPTIKGTHELLEVHIFDFSKDIYGLKVSVELIEYIRPEQKFINMEMLKNQIAEDCIKIRKVFA